MKTRILGKFGPIVSAVGLGCMGMSEFYGKSEYAESRKTLLGALESGVTFLDTADCYANGQNEELLGDILKEWCGDVFVATKFGIVREPGVYERQISGRPEYVQQAAEASLRRLKRDVIDLYYLHRIDVNVPIEETIGAMANLVQQGKVRYIGISEASASTIRRAHSVHPLTAVQSEYSLMTRHIENEVLPVLRELGIGFVAYSPLCRGLLTGQLNQALLEKESDFRKSMPRLQGENLVHNLKLADRLAKIAEQKGVTAAQISLAWVLAKGEDIVPIPGTKRHKYLMDNIEAVTIELSAEEISEIESAVPIKAVLGDRYTEAGMVGVEA
ncbi:aldo/keto reductase [Pelosinus baikalensis]|uniref:Aldo/keto reductase n=1 Tax=Pelosinus baikalensis TaxID=2892015 RepID=A0ABS8HU16_9FIRM|nr:aldo/keto reductase [Pelosinus baikalensis]MCC5466648.1 aldo/keto reductase [Pelosinus baikalensis]